MRHDRRTKIMFITSYKKENDYDYSHSTLEFNNTISGTDISS